MMQGDCFALCSLDHLQSPEGFRLSAKDASDLVIHRNDPLPEVRSRLHKLARRTKDRQSRASDLAERERLGKLIEEIEHILPHTRDEHKWSLYLNKLAPPCIGLSSDLIVLRALPQVLKGEEARLDIINNGGSILHGKIGSNKTWLMVEPVAFGPLAAGKSCLIKLRLNPHNLKGTSTETAYITITSNDPARPAARVQVNAEAAKPVLDIAPHRLVYGKIDSIHDLVPQQLSITNTGTAPLQGKVSSNVKWITVEQAAFQDIQPGQRHRCRVIINSRYLPSRGGPLSTTLTVSSNAGDPQHVYVNITISPPIAELSTTIIDFGRHWRTKAPIVRVVEIHNGGGLVLWGRIETTDPAVLQIEPATFDDLGPEQSQRVRLMLTPHRLVHAGPHQLGCRFITNGPKDPEITVRVHIRDIASLFLLGHGFWRSLFGLYHWWAGAAQSAVLALISIFFLAAIRLPTIPEQIGAGLLACGIAAAAARGFAKAAEYSWGKRRFTRSPQRFEWQELRTTLSITALAAPLLILAFDATVRTLPGAILPGIGSLGLLIPLRNIWIGKISSVDDHAKTMLWALLVIAVCFRMFWLCTFMLVFAILLAITFTLLRGAESALPPWRQNPNLTASAPRSGAVLGFLMALVVLLHLSPITINLASSQHLTVVAGASPVASQSTQPAYSTPTPGRQTPATGVSNANEGQHGRAEEPSVEPEPTPPPNTAIVTNGGRIRAAPNLQGAVLGMIHAYETLTLHARTVDGSWYRITASEGTGWVSVTLIEVTPEIMSQVPIENATQDALSPSDVKIARVFNGGRIRAQAGLSGQPIGMINAGEILYVLAKNSDATWYRIIDPRGTDGWVSVTLIEIAPSVAALVPVEE